MDLKCMIGLFVAFILGAGIAIAGFIISKPQVYIQTQYVYPDSVESIKIPMNSKKKR